MIKEMSAPARAEEMTTGDCSEHTAYSMSTSPAIKVSGALNIGLPEQMYKLLWDDKYASTFAEVDRMWPILRFSVARLVYEIQWFYFYEKWLSDKGLTPAEIESAHKCDTVAELFLTTQHTTPYDFNEKHRRRFMNILDSGIAPLSATRASDRSYLGDGSVMSSMELRQVCRDIWIYYGRFIEGDIIMKMFKGMAGVA